MNTQRTTFFFVAAAIIATSITNRTNGQTPCQPELLGSIGGRTADVEVENNIAYVALENGGLMTVDIADPEHPRVLGSLATPAAANDVEIHGSIAYLTNLREGLLIVDISVPSEPQIIGNVDTPGYAVAVKVLGDLAYIADGDGGLQIASVQDPRNPVIVGSLRGSQYLIHDVDVAGNLALLGNQAPNREPSVLAIDVSNPRKPAFLSSFQTSDDVRHITIVDQLAYVAASDDDFIILDISDPMQMTMLGSAELSGSALTLAVAENLAYAGTRTDSNGAFHVLDISDPTDPIEIGPLRTTHAIYSIDLSDGIACLANGLGGGIAIVDIAAPSDPINLGNMYSPNVTYDLSIVNEIAYIVENGQSDWTGFGRLHLIDFSDPASPVRMSWLDLPDGATDVVIENGYAFVSATGAGLQIADVSDPFNPKIVSSVPSPPRASGITVVDGTAYVFATTFGLRFIDVSDPLNPVVLGELPLKERALGIRVVGALAYIACMDYGLLIVDVSDPANPIELGRLLTFGANDVAVRGTLAYLAGGIRGLHVVDISNPQMPTLVGSVDWLGEDAWDLDVNGTTVFVANGNGEEQAIIIDARDPTRPFVIKTIQIGTAGVGVQVTDGILYLGAHTLVAAIDVSSCDNCLSLTIDNLVHGEVATFNLFGGTPGARAVVVYGTQEGVSVFDDVGGYCATFGIRNVRPSRIVGGINRTFDDNGTIEFELKVPDRAAGRLLLFQAAEQGTCPDECVSNLVQQFVY